MKCIKRGIIIGILFVLAAGSLSHFLYDWSSRQSVIGLFTPVNESVWEHMKLLFFPMLLFSLFMAGKLKNRYPCVISALCFGILAGTVCIPTLFYAYTFAAEKSIFILDLAIFLFSTITAFFLAYQLTLSCRMQAYTAVLFILVCALFACFIVFTYHPPSFGMFLSGNI